MTLSRYQDLPLADRDRRWDADGERRGRFTACKLPIADDIDGPLRAVPRGDETRLRHHLGRYYVKLGEAPPWRKAA